MRYFIVRPDGLRRVWNHYSKSWSEGSAAAYDRDYSYASERGAKKAIDMIVARSKDAAAKGSGVRSFSFTELRVIDREELFKEICIED